MFLRRYTRVKDGKTHTYYALVESVRTDAGPRQHVVAYLGELNHDEQRRWQRTVSAYNCQGDCQQLRLFPDDDQVSAPDDSDIVRIRLRSVGWTGTERRSRASFERIDGAMSAGRQDALRSARTPAQLGTLLSARSDVERQDVA